MSLLQELKELFDSGKWGSLEETLKHKLEEEQKAEALKAEEQAKQHAEPDVAALNAKLAEERAGDAPEGAEKGGYPFLDGRTYRIHFKNGNSGEYNGHVLAQSFPFPFDQVESVDLIGEPPALPSE